MTASLPIPTRLLALLGVVVVAAGALLVARPLLLSEDDSSTPVTPSTATPATPSKTPTKAATPDVVLVAGLPTSLANKLRRSNVVVVSVYSGTSAADRTVVGVAKSGARSVGASHLAINVLDETKARQLERFVGAVTSPTLLVVRRPGKVVTRLEGVPDAKLVAQAAYNAGARKPAPAK